VKNNQQNNWYQFYFGIFTIILGFISNLFNLKYRSSNLAVADFASAIL
jgi:hypothetical protein